MRVGPPSTVADSAGMVMVAVVVVVETVVVGPATNSLVSNVPLWLKSIQTP